jgi:PAS domain S-box-containing protein
MLLAAIICALAAQRSSGYLRQLWLLLTVTLGLVATAQVMVVYYEGILHLPETAPWPSDVVRFVWVAPMLLLLLPQSAETSRRLDWLRLLDFAQVGIITITAYLYYFYVPSLWEGAGILMLQRIWGLYFLRDILLASGILLRMSVVRDHATRRLLGGVGIFLAVASAIDLVVRAQMAHFVVSVSWLDMLWGFQFLIPAGVALTWKKNDDRVSVPALFPHGSVPVIPQILPLAIPLLVLLMANRVAKEQLVYASTAVLASFLCFSARLTLTNTKLQRTALELQNSSRLLAAVSEGTTDAIYVKDLRGRYLMVNQAGAHLLGRTVGEVVGRLDAELFSSETGRIIWESDLEIMKAGTVQIKEEVGTAAGVTRTFLSTKGPYRDQDGKVIGLIGISRDITERQKVEKQLQQSQKLESVGNLAGGIAHDFNNLLTVIRGYSSLLLDQAGANSSFVNPVRQIDDAASRAASLTHQLLAFSRRQVLQPRVLNMNHIVRDVETLLRRLIGEDIDLLTILDPNVGSVKADQSQMEQVIMNLAVNARDAMPEGGKLTIETATVFLDAGYAKEHAIPIVGSCVMLGISDTGHGMEPETIAHIFEPFFTTKIQGKGTGLGLSTVYGIVKQSGGYIWVYSEPKRGTSFKIYLPLVEESPTAHKVSPAVIHAPGSETILLVEDDDALRKLAGTILVQSGYSILSAKSPDEALKISSDLANSFALLLTDVVMPGMNGRELSRRISEQRPGIPTLFMSGYTTNAIVHQGVLDSDLAFLPKPFTAEVLRARVREVLDACPPA